MLAVAVAHPHHGIEHLRHSRQLGTRIGMRDAAAQRAAIARLHMPDPGHGLTQQGQRRQQRGMFGGMTLQQTGTEGHMVSLDTHALERRDVIDIDQHRRPHQTHGHHRHQALTTRDQFGIATELREQGTGLLDAVGALVFESCSFHGE